MRGITVEYQRFGDPTGVLRLSDRYIRTVGHSEPAEEVSFTIRQENLNEGMDALDYENFQRAPGDLVRVRDAAEGFLEAIAPHIAQFLLGTSAEKIGARLRKLADIPADATCQIDIVSRPLELAQLPFELLEQVDSRLVITRRIRQPWPPPEIVQKDVPRILFAWAEPKRRPSSRKGMEVPHDRHLELLKAHLQDWGKSAIWEVEHATKAKLVQALKDSFDRSSDNDNRFTHVHLLAHGVPPARTVATDRVDLFRPPDPATLVALENEEGVLDLCSPDELANIFTAGPRPETFALATCHSGEVDPVRSGATLAHVLHAAGVPVVLASQFALTKDGSDELIRTFLAQVLNGNDPREALRATRAAMRDSADKTYYDRVALVGYVHVDDGLDERLKQRKFNVALHHLNAISRDAGNRLQEVTKVVHAEKGLTPGQRDEAEKIRQRFTTVRDQLATLEPDLTLSKKQLEELRGLQGSSLKREAEAAWGFACVLGEQHKQEWLDLSRNLLREAAAAYRRAAELSRDHHWVWVQWLVLEAVQRGSLADCEEDWTATKAAARDHTKRVAPTEADKKTQDANAEQRIWGWGSLAELNLLAPLVGRNVMLSEAQHCLANLVSSTRELPPEKQYPIKSTLQQLDRYRTWWGVDSHWKLPSEIVEHAEQLHAYLKSR